MVTMTPYILSKVRMTELAVGPSTIQNGTTDIRNTYGTALEKFSGIEKTIDNHLGLF
jgi:hypothetical protein